MPKEATIMAYDVEAIRKKLKQSQAGKYTDPDEFKPAKAKDGATPIKYRFYVLPPLLLGSKLKSGEVKKAMEQFFIQHGNHWVNDRPHPCPRVWEGADCEICKFGFDLLREEKDEDKRRSIVKQWMPTTYNAVNIYFPHWKHNPEELRGKVKWYNGPKTCFDHWTATLMKEDAGDPEEPEAFGVFYDESAGFLYQLEVLKQGKQNSYKTSHFLPNGGVGQPMVKNEDNSANKKGIDTLLRLRHNLWDKLEEPDPAKIKKLARVMIDGDDDDDDEGGGFDADETKSKSETKTESKPESKPPPKKDDDDDDVVSHLPADDADDDTLAAEVPLGETKDDESSPDGEESDEISALLSQLEDDD
jgi:hypothetical protein